MLYWAVKNVYLLAVMEALEVVLTLLLTLDWILTLGHTIREIHPDGIAATDLKTERRISNHSVTSKSSGVGRDPRGWSHLALRAPA